jgi:hypothetical protein
MSLFPNFRRWAPNTTNTGGCLCLTSRKTRKNKTNIFFVLSFVFFCGRFEDMKDRKCCQIVARTVLLEKDALRILLIRDGWMNPDIPINVGDILHFIGDFGTGKK